ncbi:ATP-binding protein [Streptomyces sp. NPDC090306]|uniref:ATP-binding protein n=1 Tax=unclassified Streptomyces TaxID=2593676 RepID=UPI0036E466C8
MNTMDGKDKSPNAARSAEETFTLRGRTKIAEARALAAGFLAQAAKTHRIRVRPSTVETTLLVVSELATNARKFAYGVALLHLQVDDEMVRVTLWDQDPELPRTGDTDPERPGQHGLEIVTAVVQKVEIHQEALGKRVTGHIACA